MDNIAHGFVGALMAESGLDRLCRRATLILVVAANLPDIDSAASLLGLEAMFHWRRGWTHGALALLVLPWVLAAIVYCTDRPRGPPADAENAARREPPASFWVVLGLSYAGILSHSFLDWLNTYGVRLGMPFDATWHYGDSLFIVDPWVWWLAGLPVFLSSSVSRHAILAWVVFATVATGALLHHPVLPVVTKVLWLAGLALAFVLRRRRHRQGGAVPVAGAARFCGVLLVAYIAAMQALAARATTQAREWALRRGLSVVDAGAVPLAGDPVTREVVLDTGDEYYIVTIEATGGPGSAAGHRVIPRGPRTRVVEAALRQVPGTAHWLRFPVYQVEDLPQGYRVSFHDARYMGRDALGPGTTQVLLGPTLEPLDEIQSP